MPIGKFWYHAARVVTDQNTYLHTFKFAVFLRSRMPFFVGSGNDLHDQIAQTTHSRRRVWSLSFGRFVSSRVVTWSLVLVSSYLLCVGLLCVFWINYTHTHKQSERERKTKRERAKTREKAKDKQQRTNKVREIERVRKI